VGFADSDPPGVEGAAAVVLVVPFDVVVVFVVVTVVVPSVAFVVVVVLPPAPVVVVVVAPPSFWVVVVDFDPDAECLEDAFFVADGLEEPHAAATRPPTRRTATSRSEVVT
jgi:hypothetical protein